MTPAPRSVVLVALDGVQLLDIAGPLDVFDAANRVCAAQGRPAAYVLQVVGPEARLVSGAGLGLAVTDFLRFRSAVDTILVAGALDFAKRRFESGHLRWIGKRTDTARRVGSICTGAFVLARLGLLDKKRATTHWLMVEELARQVPSAIVERDMLYVRDGNVYTSAGVTAGLDLALALIEDDLGHEIATMVARALVVFMHRPGGQSQFSVALQHQATGDDRIRRIQAIIVERPGDDHSVENLAGRAAMSRRTFSRVFRQEVGIPPGEFVRRARIEAAQRHLERSHETLDQIAGRCGFGTTESMRRAFVSVLGVAPGAYRSRFGPVR